MRWRIARLQSHLRNYSNDNQKHNYVNTISKVGSPTVDPRQLPFADVLFRSASDAIAGLTNHRQRKANTMVVLGKMPHCLQKTSPVSESTTIE